MSREQILADCWLEWEDEKRLKAVNKDGLRSVFFIPGSTHGTLILSCTDLFGYSHPVTLVLTKKGNIYETTKDLLYTVKGDKRDVLLYLQVHNEVIK